MKKVILLPIIYIISISLTSFSRQNTWEFNYPGDDFTANALLDLRYLNENRAGDGGFIKLSDDGASFVKGDGTPIRFWAVNSSGATGKMSEAELAQHARFLAKIGVNMNRWHGSINPSGKDSHLHEIDTAEVDAIWRFVAAMKKEGIYSTISPFWCHNGHMGGWVPEEWGIEGYSGKNSLWGVMYFNDKLKDAYKVWVKYLYTEVNPYTGLALKDDPAVGLIQIKNEDSVFFWTIAGLKPALKKVLMQLFTEWLTVKYESLTAAFEAWDGTVHPDDKPAEGVLGIYDISEMIQEVSGGKARRIADQTEFYAYRQKSFYDEIRGYYRNELGCPQLINPNNWRTADPRRLDDLERYTYSGCEVPAVNRYYDPGHFGQDNGWRINPGHYYQGNSCLRNPLQLPVNVKQTAGSPMMITESGWNLPHLYQSEAPALIAAYQSLTGHDAYYWFALNSANYHEFPYFESTKDENGMHAMHRWTYSTPGGIAQFPAYALLYRKGYISEGELMIHEMRSLESMWNREPALISEETSFDPNRDLLEGISEKSASSRLNPYAFLTGPVKVTFGGDPENTYINDKLKELIDMEEGTVKSVTGELMLNHKKGVFTFETEKAVGVSGFTAEQQIFKLGDVIIDTKNEYITVGVVAMDDRPLAESERVLIQTGTTYRPTNWKDEPAEFETRKGAREGFRIINTGEMPWLAQATMVTITMKNEQIYRATLLDLAGYPARDLEVERANGGVRVTLPPDSLYVVFHK